MAHTVILIGRAKEDAVHKPELKRRLYSIDTKRLNCEGGGGGFFIRIENKEFVKNNGLTKRSNAALADSTHGLHTRNYGGRLLALSGRHIRTGDGSCKTLVA
jgi:hypothetical protein